MVAPTTALKESSSVIIIVDERVKLIDASPVDPSWTGKAWGLHRGLQSSSAASDWILCVDADVTVQPQLARSLLHHAERSGVTDIFRRDRTTIVGQSRSTDSSGNVDHLDLPLRLPRQSHTVIAIEFKPTANVFLPLVRFCCEPKHFAPRKPRYAKTSPSCAASPNAANRSASTNPMDWST